MAREAEYSIQGLLDGIERCKKNIDTFNQAISQERSTIAQYRQMIEVLEEKKRLSEGLVIDGNSLN